MQGLPHQGWKYGDFQRSLWPDLGNGELVPIESICYGNEGPVNEPISKYGFRLATSILKMQPSSILAHSMGGLTLISALGYLDEWKKPWKGNIVFIETPFNGAPRWKLKRVGYPVDKISVQDMFHDSEFMKSLRFEVLDGCLVLCILGSFSNKYFGLYGRLAKPVMDPFKRFKPLMVNGYPGIEHNALLREPRAGKAVKEFLQS